MRIMNWINKIFGNSPEQKVNKISSYPEWNYELELLKRLNRSKVNDPFNGNTYVENIFRDLVPNLNNKIQNYVDSDILRISNFKDNLFNEFIVKELKEILKTKELKVTGKKKELVERILENFEQSEITNPKLNIRKFSLTNRGKETVENYESKFESELVKFQKDVYDLLYVLEYDKAFDVVANFYASYPFPLGFSNWSSGFITRDKDKTIYLRGLNLNKYDDKIDEDMNSILCTELATYNLFSYNYFNKYEIVEKFNKYLPDFNPKLIEDFLKNTPTGLFRFYTNPSVKDRIEMFIHFIMNKAHNVSELREIKKDENTHSFYKGVSIIRNRKDCSLCSEINGEMQNFKWKELDSLPKLPIYPGCTCLYVRYIKREE